MEDISKASTSIKTTSLFRMVRPGREEKEEEVHEE